MANTLTSPAVSGQTGQNLYHLVALRPISQPSSADESGHIPTSPPCSLATTVLPWDGEIGCAMFENRPNVTTATDCRFNSLIRIRKFERSLLI